MMFKLLCKLFAREIIVFCVGDRLLHILVNRYRSEDLLSYRPPLCQL